MFFEIHDFQCGVSIDKLFSKPGLELNEVLEHVEVIQEAKNRNKLLVSYLTTTSVLSELIELIITEPPPDLKDEVRFKLPFIASEIIACEIPEVYYCLTSDNTLLNRLYSFIEQDPPLNPLLSSFFSKAFGILLSRIQDQNWYLYQVNYLRLLNFLQTKEFTNHLIKHIRTSAISDLVLKLITSAEEKPINEVVLKWLNNRKLVESIVELLDPKHDRDTHENASKLLIDILEASRQNNTCNNDQEKPSDPILLTLESTQTVESLLQRILEPDAPESIAVNGTAVLLALLKTSPVSSVTVDAIVPKISDFTKLLSNPSSRSPLRTTAGVLEPPLGAMRLSVAKLISALIVSKSMKVNLELTKNCTLSVLLDLFFKYSLNNFLHYQVVKCIYYIFNWSVKDTCENDFDLFSAQGYDGENCTEDIDEAETVEKVESNPLLIHLYSECHLVERLLDAWEENETEEKQQGFQRKGYMGHLTKIANFMLDTSVEMGSRQIIWREMNKLPQSVNSRWERFVNEKLAEVNKCEITAPPSTYCSSAFNSEEDSPVVSVGRVQQIEAMTPTFDEFGLSEIMGIETNSNECKLEIMLGERTDGSNGFQNKDNGSDRVSVAVSSGNPWNDAEVATDDSNDSWASFPDSLDQPRNEKLNIKEDKEEESELAKEIDWESDEVTNQSATEDESNCATTKEGKPASGDSVEVATAPTEES